MMINSAIERGYTLERSREQMTLSRVVQGSQVRGTLQLDARSGEDREEGGYAMTSETRWIRV